MNLNILFRIEEASWGVILQEAFLYALVSLAFLSLLEYYS
jgi:hypothetical protein